MAEAIRKIRLKGPDASVPAIATAMGSTPSRPRAVSAARGGDTHWRELDGLRALAVAGVLFTHFWPDTARHFNWGIAGVHLFMVLSGFLITRILVQLGQEREHAEVGATAWNFWTRRAWRLWPAFFASLALAVVCNIDGARADFPWHAGFATNWLIFQRGEWTGLLTHYWSLAVEHQFYVLWPLVFFLGGRRAFHAALTLCIVIGPLSRLLLQLGGVAGTIRSQVALPSCLDFFALGGAVACVLARPSFDAAMVFHRFRFALATLFAAALALALWLATSDVPTPWLDTLSLTLQGWAFAALVGIIVANRGGTWTRWLGLRPLVYLGTISYGIYLYHNFMLRLGPGLLRRLTGSGEIQSAGLRFLFLSVLSCVVAAASYHLLEKPLRQWARNRS